METCNWDPIYVGIGYVEILEPLLERANLGSEERFTLEGPECGLQLDGPIGRVVDEGVVPNPRVPHVAAEEGENDEELHPFWRLLELTGYELW